MTGVIILNYYSHTDTLRLFSSLKGYPELKLLVVDNSCDPAEMKALKTGIPDRCLLASPRNLGYAGGNNLGIRKMLEDGDIETIALLNPDIRVRDNIFPELDKAIRANPKLAAVAPRLCIDGDEEKIYSDGGILVKNGYLKPGHIHRDQNVNDVSRPGGAAMNEVTVRNIDYVNGSFIVLNVDAIRDVGLFNETFFLYFEEADWCIRARSKGWELRVLTEVTAWQGISDKGALYNYYYFRGWMLFLHLHDRDGVRLLLADQLRKIKWILQSNDEPFTKRLHHSWNRLKGIIMGLLNR